MSDYPNWQVQIVLPLGGPKPKPKFKPPVRALNPPLASVDPAGRSSSSLVHSTSSPIPSSDPAPAASLLELGPATPSVEIARKKLAKPFKVPLAPAKPDPPSSSFLPTFPPSTSLLPSKVDAPVFSTTQSAARKTLAKPFRTPLATLNGRLPAASSASSTARPGAKRGAELAGLQRRAQVLRQAVKYEKAKETGGVDSDAELETLCEKWKEAGK